MIKEDLFPNWIKNILILLSIWNITREFTQPNELNLNIIVIIFYPILLLLIYFLSKGKNPLKFGNENYFFNISISIVGIFTLLLCSHKRQLIEYIGKLMGANFSITTDYENIDYDEYGTPSAPDIIFHKNPSLSYVYDLAYLIYLFLFLYFTFLSWHLSKKIKENIKDSNTLRGKNFMDEVDKRLEFLKKS